MSYFGCFLLQDFIGFFWREICVLNNFVIIGLEVVGYNVQIFDMNKVVDLKFESFVIFDFQIDFVGFFDDLFVGCVYNVVIDWDNEYVIVVGVQFVSQVCKVGLEYIDLSDLSNFIKFGCVSFDGYIYDV